MEDLRICAAAILIACMFIVNPSTRAADHEREVETSEASWSDNLGNLFSFSTSSYRGKLKTLINQAHGAYYFPPNIDFRAEGGGEEAEAVSHGGGSSSAGKKVKEAVAKSLEKSKATVEDSATSAAAFAKEKLTKSLSSHQQPPLRSSEL